MTQLQEQNAVALVQPAELQAAIADVGSQLGRAFTQLIDSVPGQPRGPADLGRAIGVDKVLASRVYKAARDRDSIAVMYLMPGPEPLRRFVRAAARHQVPAEVIARATAAVNEFEALIRREVGDRAALDAILSAWLPEARGEFELRRKQAAFRAVSELKGAAADVNLGTVLLHPAENGTHLDVVWIFGLFGLRRLRPGSRVKFASRREARGPAPRSPRTLDGVPVSGLEGLRLDEFSSQPPAALEVHPAGETVHYVLGANGFGPRSATDLVFAEVNFAEMDRYVPAGSPRKGYVYAEVGTPSRTLLFDVLVHGDVYPGSEPALFMYDTVLDGVASVNDRARDIDRLEFQERIQPLGRGIDHFRTTDLPRYANLLKHVCQKLRWDGEVFRGYRCRVDYPFYGSQVAMAFDPPEG